MESHARGSLTTFARARDLDDHPLRKVVKKYDVICNNCNTCVGTLQIFQKQYLAKGIPLAVEAYCVKCKGRFDHSWKGVTDVALAHQKGEIQ